MKKQYHARKKIKNTRCPNKELMLNSFYDHACEVLTLAIRQPELTRRAERLRGAAWRALHDPNANVTYTRHLYRLVRNELDIYNMVHKLCGGMRSLSNGSVVNIGLNDGESKITFDKHPGGGMVALTVGIPPEGNEMFSQTITAGYSDTMHAKGIWPTTMRSIAIGALACGNLKKAKTI